MEQFRSTQRNKALYYTSDQDLTGNEPWLLISFENQWFNAIDIRQILRSLEYACPYKELQIRWLYPQPPQKISQSKYKETLQEIDHDLWVPKIVPNFDAYTDQCHCQSEHIDQPRFQRHLASGNLHQMISNPTILDRLL